MKKYDGKMRAGPGRAVLGGRGDRLGRRGSEGHGPAGSGARSTGLNTGGLTRPRKGQSPGVAGTERTSGNATRVRSEFRQVGGTPCPQSLCLLRRVGSGGMFADRGVTWSDRHLDPTGCRSESRLQGRGGHRGARKEDAAQIWEREGTAAWGPAGRRGGGSGLGSVWKPLPTGCAGGRDVGRGKSRASQELVCGPGRPGLTGTR